MRNADTAAQAAREQKEQALTKLADGFKVYLPTIFNIIYNYYYLVIIINIGI